jgi:hypothetical protein
MNGTSLELSNDLDQYVLNSCSRPVTQKDRVHGGFQQLLKKEHVSYTTPTLPIYQHGTGMFGGIPNQHTLAAIPNLSGALPSPTTVGMLPYDFSAQTNAGLFGQQTMLAGGMSGELYDSRGGALGLNLMSSDYSHRGASSTYSQQLQSRDSFYAPKPSILPDTAAENRQSSMDECGEAFADGEMPQFDEIVCKARNFSDLPQHDDLPDNDECVLPAKHKATTAKDKLVPDSMPSLNCGSKPSRHDDTFSSQSAKCSDIQVASPTKAAASYGARSPSVTSDALSSDFEKRSRTELSGPAASLQKRQRVAV